MTRDVLIDGRTLFVGHRDRAGVSTGDDGGLYHRDTRHLSALSVTVEEADVVTIGRNLPASHRRTVVGAAGGSTVNRVDDTEQKRADLVVEETQAVGADVGLAGRVEVVNHARSPFEGTLAVTFGVDFADLFEVRGFSSSLDRDVAASVGDQSVRYGYEYEHDGSRVHRSTTVRFARRPTALERGRATFGLQLGCQERTRVGYVVRPNVTEGEGGDSQSDPDEVTGPEAVTESVVCDPPTVSTGRRDYDRVFERAAEDLAALAATTDYGPVPVAGAPWFGTVFGRDSLVAAYQTLPVAPSLAAGTLRYLAAHLGTTEDEVREEEPGKVFHEVRDGELARRGIVPHAPYYGSVDATPLWVILLAEHHRWVGDDAIVEDLSDALGAAVSWFDERRRSGSDPFLYYDQSPTGLPHKAWRDTPGAVQHPDGRVVEPPLASVEVQGYVYRALGDAADLFENVLGEPDRAGTLREEAEELADAFEAEFWLPDREFYALAKAGDGSVVETATSGVGHCLWTGIVDEARAPAVARTLCSDELFSGWGLRTVAPAAASYSPVSYHLGSVWPHDTSLAALGLAEYGLTEAAERLARGVFDAATHFGDRRVPELFCGFDDDVEPVPYPSSCVPQAWSAGAPFALLRAVFGLEPSDAGGVETESAPETLASEAIDPIRERWNE